MNLKGLLKVVGLAALGGALGGVAQWGHGVDPATIGCTGAACQPYLHQVGLAAGTGAVAAVVGLFVKSPMHE